ncbi:aminotransferase class I/II-fold pyridoxal phosphate-dependent enzyme [Microbacterium sp. SSW1-59]|uniref:aminotransferase class I/II-fold pyridoxal phosphate-dependent enzyme n=1 Tax=Microbacterium xanthum TaxID=3079794 RepID=UPI002AD5AD12|nr:aminotransferase class I/II-fold pyridoxal phosphate-dependent enzyme [Microbacterium sp. SSW1-59]MDZ8202393.1 aminotransferase class I/II-fold pyridoxal phosphate-dependent enzyme [Microbacterium sp. SSW1-59]
MHRHIQGTTAAEIAASVRSGIDRGELQPGDALPPVRVLALDLGVNRNTAVAAYRQLAASGLVVSRGRSGTRIAAPTAVAQEGYAHDSALHDLGTGNPDPRLIPDLSPALARAGGHPVLYGEPMIDPGLEHWATAWMADATNAARARLTVTSGAADAVERLLAQALAREDAMGLEDPCFLTSKHTVQVGGYRAVPIACDDEGMTVAGLRDALAAGVRAVVCTPRAQNPSGASVSARRAHALRSVLAAHPYVLVIEDDHYSLLSTRPFHSVVPSGHRRWALVRSVSKFLGPDMCLAVVSSDADTASGLARRLTPGTTWVSHLLQRLVHALLSDSDVLAGIDDAAAHYAARNLAFVRLLHEQGVSANVPDGLNAWVDVGGSAREAVGLLMRRGWLARGGDEFTLADGGGPSRWLRLTVHDLTDEAMERLARDVAAAAHGARRAHLGVA